MCVFKLPFPSDSGLTLCHQSDETGECTYSKSATQDTSSSSAVVFQRFEVYMVDLYSPTERPRPGSVSNTEALRPPVSTPVGTDKTFQSALLQWESVDIGPSARDWQLAQKPMAKSLTLSLLQGEQVERWDRGARAESTPSASMDSCCLDLKAFHNLKERISYFCENLDTLSPPEEVRSLSSIRVTSLGDLYLHWKLIDVGSSDCFDEYGCPC